MILSQDDEDRGQPDLESDDEDQKSVNDTLKFEVQNDVIIQYMHNISIMAFSDEIIRTNRKQDRLCLYTT
jgi:hypothetical protein